VADLIRLSHGSGGGMTHRLIRDVFLRHLNDPELAKLSDSAVLRLPKRGGECDTQLAFTTDSYVVSPLEFPGGDIGKLAVCGTVNDLAAAGARPLWLSASWVLEEGLSMELLDRLVASMAEAANLAGVTIVAGDTKVVPHGLADGAYVTTAGVGVVPPGRQLGPEYLREGDAILVNGTIGDHGMAVLLQREGITMSSALVSDCAALNGLVEALFDENVEVHCLRDATRGGVAGVLCEVAERAQLGVELEENDLPIRPEVAGACELLGFDPLFVANEGKMIAFVAAEDAGRALSIWCSEEGGTEAAIIGHVTTQHAGLVVQRTPLGTGRILKPPMGELLPRIC